MALLQFLSLRVVTEATPAPKGPKDPIIRYSVLG